MCKAVFGDRQPSSSPMPSEQPQEPAFSSPPPRSRPDMTLAAIATLILMLAVTAMMITTINRQQISLDDGSVWISADSQQAIARFNIGSGDNDAVLESSAQHTDVIQSGDQLAMLSNRDLSTIQPSTLRTTALTRLPRHQTITTGGTIMALLDTDSGDLRVGLISAAQRITNSTPVGNVGKHGRVTVDANGVVYGLHAEDGTVSRWEYRSSSDIVHTKLGSLSQGQSVQADDLTVVDEHAIALQGRTLFTSNGSVQLPSQFPTTNSTATPAADRMPSPVLQRPSYDDKPLRNDRGHALVAVGDAGSMHMIDLHDLKSKPFTLRTSGTGTPVNPIVAQSCLHVAWHQPSNNYLRACLPDLTTASPRTLSSISSTSALTFRVNHRSILLNDTMSGDIWHPVTGSRVLQPNWKLNDRQQSPRTAKHRNLIRQREFTKQCTEQQGSLTAKDDHHAIRAGNRGLLDVLRNDEQSDCTVLRVSRVDRLSGESGLRIYPVQAGRQLQVDATHARAGTYRFTYGIDAGDHRSSSATLTLTVVGRQNENHAPRQNSNLTNTQVEQNGTVQINALDGFADDDGDALTLIAATPMNSDAVTVRSRPDGLLTFHAGAQPLGKVEVKVTVSDSKRSTTGLLRFSVVETNTLPAVVDRFAQTAYAKQQTVIDLGPYVHANASQPATLTAVQPPSGASVAISNNGRNSLAPSLLFTAAASGDYAVRFTITQGEHATPGLVRVIVPQSQSNNNSTLTIMDDTATLRSDASALVDVLDNDQADDALAITAVDVSGHPGFKAAITEEQQVLITADTMPDAPLTITYRATDGRYADNGHIRVLPANETPYAPVQPRTLHADLAVHGTIFVPILERLGLTDGDITIDPTLKLQQANRQTLAFVTADTIRFQAGATPGSFPVTYTLSNDEGSATGTIVFDVRARDAARQSSPVPKDVTVQVTAGASTNISIPITGIDADGDTVMLSGLGTRSPRLGRVTEIGADRLRYEAYPDAQGIDEFAYAVEDWTGRRAQGRIRVAILRSEPDAKLLARNDSAQIRPGDTMTIPVLSNDVLPDDGSGVRTRITDVQGIHSSQVQVDDDKGTVRLTAPRQAGTAYVSYVIQDTFGRTDSAILTIRIDAKIPWTPPTVSDHYVPPSDTIDQRIIQVDIANSIVDALGPQSSLTVSVHSLAAANARKLPGTDSVIEVRLTERSYAIPYMVHDSRHDLTATAFIHVPAYGAFPPSHRPHAPLLRVKSGETIRFDVNDHVRVGAGKHAYVPSQDSVHATKSESGTRLLDWTTLAFTAKRDYSGPASITFAVAETSIASSDAARQSENTATDGNDSTDHPAVTVITLPITVYGHRMPPTFRSTTVDVEAGEI